MFIRTCGLGLNIMDESKTLVSFQIAGLLIQNSFRYLLNAMKSFNRRRLFKFYTLWKRKALNYSQSTQMSIKNSIVRINIKLKSFEKMLQCKAASIFHEAFIRIILLSSQKHFEKKFQNEEQSLKSSHDLELQNLNKSIKSMQDTQETLEKTLKKMRTREESSKTQASEIFSKKADPSKSRKKIILDKDSDLPDKIEQLKEENHEIKEKIALVEKNLNHFLAEIGGLIETPEETDKTIEKRKISSKKLKVMKKTRGALNTIDLTKLA